MKRTIVWLVLVAVVAVAVAVGVGVCTGVAVDVAVAVAVAEAALVEGLAGVELDDIVQQVQDAMWQPEYRQIQAG